MWRVCAEFIRNEIFLPVVAILHSVFVIIFYKMALLFTDQVYPDINKMLAVIGCDRFSALPPLSGVCSLWQLQEASREPSPHIGRSLE